MAAACAAIVGVFEGIALILRSVHVASPVTPLAFDQDAPFVGDAHQARVEDVVVAIAIDDDVAGFGTIDREVAVVVEDGLNLLAADPVAASGEHPAVAV